MKFENLFRNFIFGLIFVLVFGCVEQPESSDFHACATSSDCVKGYFCAKDPTRVTGDIKPELESIKAESPASGICITSAQSVEPTADGDGTTGPTDAAPIDGPTPDARPRPDAVPDATPPPMEAGRSDASPDGPLADAGPRDARPADAAPPHDALPLDAGLHDAAPDVPPADAAPDAAPPPDLGPPPECEPGFGLGSVQACEGSDVGECRPGERLCRPVDGDAVWSDCFGRVEPSNEVCDGLDNDCDGTADDDFVDLTQACGQGACARELPVCEDGQRVVCSPFEGAQPEQCDGVVDNDCDGSVDEGCDCADGAEEACGPPEPVVEPCARGIRHCNNGRWSVCEGAHFPAAETCNNIDDDCDNETDEGVKNACDRCGAVPNEVCNDFDDNCNGAIDEDLRNACGLCGPVPREVCNLTDDDCDGVTDNNFLWLDPESEEEVATGAECTVGVGACERTGEVFCAAADRAECNTQSGDPSPELCNGIDDDCDGEIDDGPADIGTPCTVGVGFCQRNGAEICRDGHLVCGVQPGASRAEGCNNIDDDCDGTADNNFAGDTITCGIGVCFREVVEQCVAGRIEVQCTPGEPTGEDNDCDGLDNDCDGETDEGYVPTPTECGLGECFATGERICDNGAERDTCVPGPLAGADDDCDGIDENCNGTSDENYVDVPIQCGLGVCQRDGLRVCRDHTPVDDCTPGRGNGDDAECNGEDNNCNGAIDENSRIGVACTSGLGPCQRNGIVICDGGAATCDAVPGEPSPERYNDIDDDCDGTVDEDTDGCEDVQPIAGWICAPRGRFLMGSPEEEPHRRFDENQHEVRLTRSFLTKQTEVTRAEWAAIVGSCPNQPCDDHPVDNVSWYEVIAFANALSLAEALPRCYVDRDDESEYDFADATARKVPGWRDGVGCTGYRLPTESEWEYMARAGTNGPTYSNDPWVVDNNRCVDATNPIAWYSCNAENHSHPVGGLAPNPWGLDDTLGNVWEWVFDRYGQGYPPGPLEDPTGPVAGANRVARGASYLNDGREIRAAVRVSVAPTFQAPGVGFRLVRTVLPVAQ